MTFLPIDRDLLGGKRSFLVCQRLVLRIPDAIRFMKSRIKFYFATCQ